MQSQKSDLLDRNPCGLLISTTPVGRVVDVEALRTLQMIFYTQESSTEALEEQNRLEQELHSSQSHENGGVLVSSERSIAQRQRTNVWLAKATKSVRQGNSWPGFDRACVGMPICTLVCSPARSWKHMPILIDDLRGVWSS